MAKATNNFDFEEAIVLASIKNCEEDIEPLYKIRHKEWHSQNLELPCEVSREKIIDVICDYIDDDGWRDTNLGYVMYPKNGEWVLQTMGKLFPDSWAKNRPIGCTHIHFDLATTRWFDICSCEIYRGFDSAVFCTKEDLLEAVDLWCKDNSFCRRYKGKELFKKDIDEFCTWEHL